MLLNLEVPYSDFLNLSLQFTECRLFIDTHVNDISSLRFWGLTIHKEASIIKDLMAYIDSSYDAFYVSGFTDVIFDQVVEGSISVALYDRDGTGFLKDTKNKEVRITKQWKNKYESLCKEYQFLCACDWPYGYSQVKISAVGKVILKINTENIIDAQTYIRNVDKYGYSGNSKV